MVLGMPLSCLSVFDSLQCVRHVLKACPVRVRVAHLYMTSGDVFVFHRLTLFLELGVHKGREKERKVNMK